LFAIALLLILAFPLPGWARAGGGGGFSGGGGGGGSGGDGAGILIRLLIRLIFYHPAIGIPLAIIAVYLFYKSSQGTRAAYVGSTIRRGNLADIKQRTVERQKRFDEARQNLLERDPAFDENAFLERAANVFLRVQQAWSAQDMSKARAVVSDGIYERFQLQLKMQRESFLRNIMQDVVVHSSAVLVTESDAFFDTLHVRITASAIDYTEDIRNGKTVQGDKNSPKTFSEVWSFLRRPSARTLQKPGLIEGFCPNCGTPLEIADSTVCPSCRAVINSGEYDWVLAEITQLEAWKEPNIDTVTGLPAMVRKDPAFNTQHIEDRTSVIFWHLRAAEFFADSDYLRKCALPEYLTENGDAFRSKDDGRHRFYADAAVGSVEVDSVVVNEDSGDFDAVYVHITWSGHLEELPVPSLVKPDYDSSRLMSQAFKLVRRSDVTTDSSHSLSSFHCPGCGAPQSVSSNGNCEYCGLAQNDGSSDWVLAKVEPYYVYSMRRAQTVEQPLERPLDSHLSDEDNRRLIQCAAAVMLADGEIDPKEEQLLTSMAERRNINRDELQSLINQVRADGITIPIAVGDNAGNYEFIKALVRMCLADGKVTAQERAMIQSLVHHMGYLDADIDIMIAEERARLYREARATLNHQRKNSLNTG